MKHASGRCEDTPKECLLGWRGEVVRHLSYISPLLSSTLVMCKVRAFIDVMHTILGTLK